MYAEIEVEVEVPPGTGNTLMNADEYATFGLPGVFSKSMPSRFGVVLKR